MRSRALIMIVLGGTILASCGISESAETTPPAGVTTTRGTPSTTSTTGSTSMPSTTSTDLATTTTTTFPVDSVIVLKADGLGAVEFGEPTASVMETLASVLGPSAPGEEYPYGGHPLRHTYWENVGLAIIFSDYEFYRGDAIEHLAGWIHSRYIGELAGWDHEPSSLPLQTAEGIGIGSTLADLQSAYPGRVNLEAECDPEGEPTAAYVQFTDPDDGGSHSIRFGFESLPIDPNSRISYIGAGAGPGC